MASASSSCDAPRVPLHAAFDLAALRSTTGLTSRSDAPARRATVRAAISAALIAATLILALGSTGVLAATTITPKCDATNLRTGPGTSYAKKTSVNIGAKLVAATSVTGSSWTATGGGSLAGTRWYKITQIKDRS